MTFMKAASFPLTDRRRKAKGKNKLHSELNQLKITS